MTDVPPAAQLARRMYTDGAPVRDILAASGLSQSTFYTWLQGGPKHNGKRPLPALPGRRQGLGKRVDKTDRVQLITRLMSGAQTLVREIELRLAKGGGTPKDTADDSRAFATLTRTLRELTALDAINDRDALRSGPQHNDDRDDDEPPRDIEEFRRELARRIHAFVDERERQHGRVSRGADGEVD